MAKSSHSHNSYTQSFLHQLQTEWKEFWFEVGQREPHEITPITLHDSPEKRKSLQKNLVESLNKLNSTLDDNIVIPVPIRALKKLFSPSKCNADNVFKIEILNEIKENLNLSNITCKKLQRLLLSESALEVSDFPSPSILENYRKSAPPRLLNKKIKSRQLFDKNDLFRLKDDVKNKENIPTKRNAAKENDKNLNNVIRTILDSSDDADTNPPASRNVMRNIDTNAPTISKGTLSKRNDADKRKLSIKKTKRTRNLRECGENEAERRYSSIYDLRLDSRDSSDLFVTGKSQKKNAKPTIVCTYFSQVELKNIYQIIKNLGYFEIENNVSARTTHLICGSSKKTVNLCKAVVRGCWILDKEWILSSSIEGRWLYEERFEKRDISAAIKENRMKRQKYGPVYRCTVFSACGAIYVSDNCGHPKTEDIKELVVLGGGHVTDNAEKAKFIIGYLPQRECLKETWILSCIIQGRVLSITKHFKIM